METKRFEGYRLVSMLNSEIYFYFYFNLSLTSTFFCGVVILFNVDRWSFLRHDFELARKVPRDLRPLKLFRSFLERVVFLDRCK